MEKWPPHAVRFRMNAANSFLLCTHCRNHLAPLYHCIGHVAWPGTVEGILCRSAVNVREDDISTRWFRYHLPVVYIRCDGCNRAIGEKIHACDPPTDDLYEGKYIFHVDHVMYWDGTRLREAATHHPAYNIGSP